jgi:hypothetical protein
MPLGIGWKEKELSNLISCWKEIKWMITWGLLQNIDLRCRSIFPTGMKRVRLEIFTREH